MSGPFVPFRQFVLKVHSRCDLACDHCYVYEHADQSWRGRPRAMSPETVSWSALRIAEHVKEHGLERVHVVLHGGEPLLVGAKRLGEIAAELRHHLDGVCDLDLRIHTNGVRLDERFCDVFAEHRVKVGISLDGDRAANDRHRRYADGRSSYDQVVRAVGLLRQRPALYAGLLCTIDVANDPIAVYRGLAELEPPRVDFLLPHATWDSPPPRPSATAYADWLIAIFDLWYEEGRKIDVRIFESIIRTSRGEPSLTESLGLQPSDLVVIETDGAYEQADSLKTAFAGAPETGLHVLSDTLDDVARHTGILARQLGLDGLCDTCRACPVVESCGGGLYAHRYRTGSGYANPSVFTADLLKLITHVRGRTTMPTHALPYSTIDALAAGYGGEADVTRLAESQRSVRRALLAAVNAAGRSVPEAWDVLVGLDNDHPEAVEAVLAHPYVRVWAAECLRDGGDAEYLRNIAAAAAVRAGVDVSLDIAITDRSAYLPSLGTLDALPGAAARLRIEGGSFAVEGRARGEWRPTRRIMAGDLSVALEDADPFRDRHQWPAAPRLGERDAAAWQEMVERAWRMIEIDHARYAPGLRAGLTTLTPLAPGPAGRDVSSTARHAFGAVAAALPADPATLALLVIHEFQHVKLGAVLDILDLYDETDRRLYYAPWRDDPRPLEGLLQGTYAHVAVTDFWRVRRLDAPDQGETHFARWRAHTAEAIETLAACGAMTQVGDLFVAGMRRSVTPWLSEPVPPDAEEAAARSARDHQAKWIVRAEN
ncbi:FxsB family cyclophane-forming radical SAM/SPASM peptide maturase [Microtetraspora sp. AC03309]|uniref:FxsB family cyclophane-forming radical SAM/SPASM peptide maturase n=1 Tax=Microtetraspora sp. AC03309 TaxID=2779376 RepID=UPI001E4AE9DF|nr:FxsB family cyclophane-forming radical SAM/SPASM peptide maturase [Microtetraspora sp. AC03309]